MVSATPPDAWPMPPLARGVTSSPSSGRTGAPGRRDGAAFVAHQVNVEEFTESLRMLAHSVHVDGLLLAMTQRHMIDASGDSAVAFA